MKRRKPTSSSRLAEEWLRLGIDILNEKNIQELNYQNEIIKERLLQSMGLTYWKALTRQAESDPFKLTIEDIGKKLGMHRATYNRWVTDDTYIPPLGTFIGTILLVLRQEIGEVAFPSNRAVIWQAVSRTIAMIRETECGKDRQAPSKEEFACLRRLMRDPRAGELIPENGDPDPLRVRDIIEDVSCDVRRMFPSGRLQTPRMVKLTIDEWAEPYVLFCIGLLPGWEFLDEIAV